MTSNTCKYAIRAVIYLALNADMARRISIEKISNDLEIPSPFLGKILQILVRHGILVSTKGPNGGFALGKPAERIRIMDLIEIIDGFENINKCVVGIRACGDQSKNCVMHEKYQSIRNDIKDLFKRTTVSELINDIREGKQVLFL